MTNPTGTSLVAGRVLGRRTTDFSGDALLRGWHPPQASVGGHIGTVSQIMRVQFEGALSLGDP
jgi:hypothetical protein